MSVMHSGRTAEVGTVGNEGVTGLALFFGDVRDPSESMIQVPGTGRLLSAEVFQQELARHAVFHRLIAHYAHAFTVQVMQSAACNALHPVEQRACKWMLMTHDRVFTNEFKLTHEFLGMMLGVSRPTLTIVARKLHARSQLLSPVATTISAGQDQHESPTTWRCSVVVVGRLVAVEYISAGAPVERAGAHREP